MKQHRALRVFAEHLSRRPPAGGPEVDELCKAHPDLEANLRQLARERAGVSIEAPRVSRADSKRLRRETNEENRYVLLGEIARGATGVVLRVWDTVLERPIAMKLLDPDSLSKDPGEANEALQRLLGEARIAGRLQHPGIVPIHDLGADERGRVFFTMPFCEGRTLEEVFELARSGSDGWSLWRALLLLSKVCEVMAYAHSRGVIHRDLKPANLIAGEFGEVYVVDWGLAKVVDPCEPAPDTGSGSVEASDASAGQTLEGTVAGTPPYMAPEQALGRVAEVSYQADVYALGAMLYRLLARRAPYAPREGEEEPARTLELIRRGPPTPLGRLSSEAPAELVAIAERAMARKPEDRHASVEDLARELRGFLEGRLQDIERR